MKNTVSLLHPLHRIVAFCSVACVSFLGLSGNASAAVILNTNFNTTHTGNIVANGSVANSDGMLATATADRYLSVVNVASGNNAVRFTDNGVTIGAPILYKTFTGASTNASGANYITGSFRFTTFNVSANPSMRMMVNGSSDTNGGGTSLVYLQINPTKISYSSGTTMVDAPFTLINGTEYIISIAVDASGTSQDTWNLKVALASSPNTYILDTGWINTRAANALPNILVWNGGVGLSALAANPFIQIDDLNFNLASKTGTTIWQIGLPDNSGAEFTGPTNPASYSIPNDWPFRTTWPEWKPNTLAEAWNTTISYSLASVPAGGAEFTLKSIEAGPFVPEVAVFSNNKLMGILQIMGAESISSATPNARMFGNTYRVYIPKEYLKIGNNTLRLRKLPNTYALTSNVYTHLQVYFDYFLLTSLAQVPAEPIHSRMVWMGSANGTADVNQTILTNDPLTWEWFGVAHSGNPVRASFWDNRDNSPESTKRVEWLQAARDYHMSPVLNYLGDKNSATTPSNWIDANGVLLQAKKDKLVAAFANWGAYIQYYELTNEPCMSITNSSYAVDLAIASYIAQTKPSHVKLAAPGYTYGGNAGAPVNWDLNDANRLALETFCDLTGGHCYGPSYVLVNGTPLAETIDTLGTGNPKIITNGFPKELLITECGTVDNAPSHKDYSNVGIPIDDDRYPAGYDKNLRAHIAHAHRILQFSTWGLAGSQTGTDHLCLLGAVDVQPAQWVAQAFPLAPNTDRKLKVFRRLACAYATHGKPLPYIYLNETEVNDQLVYFRAVDTSTLSPMAGNGHQPNKILLNFVNFDTTTARRMHVQITFPSSGSYSGLRFDGDYEYVNAKSNATISATPNATLDLTLAPGEAIQYILTKP